MIIISLPYFVDSEGGDSIKYVCTVNAVLIINIVSGRQINRIIFGVLVDIVDIGHVPWVDFNWFIFFHNSSCVLIGLLSQINHFSEKDNFYSSF